MRWDVHTLHARRVTSVDTTPAGSTLVVQDHAALNMVLKSTYMFVNIDVWWSLRVLINTGCVRHGVILSACRSTRPQTRRHIEAAVRKKEFTTAPIAQAVDNSPCTSSCVMRGISDAGKHHLPYHHVDFERSQSTVKMKEKAHSLNDFSPTRQRTAMNHTPLKPPD